MPTASTARKMYCPFKLNKEREMFETAPGEWRDDLRCEASDCMAWRLDDFMTGDGFCGLAAVPSRAGV